MKQQLFIIANSGNAAFYPTNALPRRYPIPPFASFFEAVWRILEADYIPFLSAGTKIEIHYGDSIYTWNTEAAASCFEKHWISEKELADRLLNVEPEKAR